MRAATMLAGDDAPAEAIAAHLLRCPPADDPWVCEQLLAAAGAAATRGGAETAAR
jgi:hypothetical protein